MGRGSRRNSRMFPSALLLVVVGREDDPILRRISPQRLGAVSATILSQYYRVNEVCVSERISLAFW